MLKRMLLFGLVASLTGCGTTYQSAGKYKLLANISRDDVGKYKVDYFSNDKGNVDLNNVQYQGDTSDIKFAVR